MGEKTRTVPCARRERAWVDEEVLAIVEQAHSCYEGLMSLPSYPVRDGEHSPKVPKPAAVAAVPCDTTTMSHEALHGTKTRSGKRVSPRQRVKRRKETKWLAFANVSKLGNRLDMSFRMPRESTRQIKDVRLLSVAKDDER